MFDLCAKVSCMGFDGDRLQRAVTAVKEEVGRLDAPCLAGPDAVALLSLLSSGKAACAAGEAACARRVETSNAHLSSGFRDASQLVAARTGVSQGEAAAQLATARRLEDLPETEARFRAGELSVAQANEVARAASVDPASEARMLELAGRDSVRALSDARKRVEATADDGDAIGRARARRFLRARQVDRFSVEIHGRMPTEDWAKVSAAWLPLRDRCFREARASMGSTPMGQTRWSRWPPPPPAAARAGSRRR